LVIFQNDGIQFQIKNKELGMGWKSGVDELSGGQKTLLSICFILSVAKIKGHGFYLLDECDAALDELFVSS
jgi:chromosome segregation ATPase